MRKKLAEEFTSGQFLVLTGLDEEVKRLSRKILTSMLKSLLDTMQLHGYGKSQVQGVWKLCDILNRWIWVTDVKTGFCEGDCYIIVFFKKRTGLHSSYQQAKTKANSIILQRKILQSNGVLNRRRNLVSVSSESSSLNLFDQRFA